MIEGKSMMNPIIIHEKISKELGNIIYIIYEKEISEIENNMIVNDEIKTIIEKVNAL